MKILCIGDSNTYGYDPRSYIGSRYPEKVRWAGRLSGHEVINCGLNGMTVPRDHQRQLGLIDLHEPDLVTVMLGTNDLLSGLSADEITERMGRLLDSLMSAGRPVLLIAPPPMSEAIHTSWLGDMFGFDEGRRKSDRLAEVYRKLAQSLDCLFLDAGEVAAPSPLDGVHLDAENQRRLGEAVARLVKAAEI